MKDQPFENSDGPVMAKAGGIGSPLVSFPIRATFQAKSSACDAGKNVWSFRKMLRMSLASGMKKSGPFLMWVWKAWYVLLAVSYPTCVVSGVAHQNYVQTIVIRISILCVGISAPKMIV